MEEEEEEEEEEGENVRISRSVKQQSPVTMRWRQIEEPSVTLRPFILIAREEQEQKPARKFQVFSTCNLPLPFPSLATYPSPSPL